MSKLTRSVGLAVALSLGLGAALYVAGYRFSSGDWPFQTDRTAASALHEKSSLGIPEAFLLPSYLPKGYRLSGVTLEKQTRTKEGTGRDGTGEFIQERFQVAELNFISDDRLDEWLYMIQWEGKFPISEPDPETREGSAMMNGMVVGIFRSVHSPEYLDFEWYDPSRDVGGYVRSYLTLGETIQIVESMQ